MKSCTLFRVSRSLLKIPVGGGLAALLLVSVAAIGYGPARAKAVSPSPVILRFTEIGVLVGTYGLVNATSPLVATARDTLAGGGTASNNVVETLYGPFADGCFAGQIQGTQTFKNPADSLSYIGIGTSCPMAGRPTDYTYANRLLITMGTGRYAGYSGSGTASGSSPNSIAPPANKPVIAPYSGTLTFSLQGK